MGKSNATKPFTMDDKRVAMELWKAKGPLATMWIQLKVGQSTM
jgi:hypothetical protein